MLGRLAIAASRRPALALSRVALPPSAAAPSLLLARRSLCGTSEKPSQPIGASSSPELWLAAYEQGTAPPLRFPLGTPVQCYVGTAVPRNQPDKWVTGRVVAHDYREDNWPEGKTVPYQILLDPKHHAGERNAIWAPADVDDIIRAGFRFKLRDEVECRVAQDEWASAMVTGSLYREQDWPEGQFAPYQVVVRGLLPGAIDATAQTNFGPERGERLIWLPDDSAEYIRARCDKRAERLEALAKLRQSGALDEELYAAKRREVVHLPVADEAPTDEWAQATLPQGKAP